MQTFKSVIEKTHTFSNLFLGQLDARCEKISTDMNKLCREAKDYGMGEHEMIHLLEQVELMNDFRHMLRDQDIQNCTGPDHADSDPGDCAPNYDEQDVEDILEKLIQGHELGYLNIPESILVKIETLLLHRN